MSAKNTEAGPSPRGLHSLGWTELCTVYIYLCLDCYRKTIQTLVTDGKADYIREDYSNGVLQSGNKIEIKQEKVGIYSQGVGWGISGWKIVKRAE